MMKEFNFILSKIEINLKKNQNTKLINRSKIKIIIIGGQNPLKEELYRNKGIVIIYTGLSMIQV